MIILDIDQDYFFLPVLSGTLLIDRNERNKTFHKANVSPSDLVDKFKLNKFNKYVKFFDDHDEVYYDLKKFNTKNNTLIHIDAHSDIAYKGTLESVNIGNWITHLINENVIDKNVIWINQNVNGKVTERHMVNDKEYFLHISKIEDFIFTNKHPIDIIYYTRSKLFCPDNNCEQTFKNLIK